MFSDIVAPKNNEEEFMEIASKLGIKKLYFLYNFDDYDEEKIKKNIEHRIINSEIGFIVNQKNINKAIKHEKTSMKFSVPQKSQSDFLRQSKLLVVKSSDKDRLFIESKKIKLIYGFEELHKKDYLHQRVSGLNHILCEIANKNNVAVGLSYGSLFNKDTSITSLIMGRMIQNIALCQKYKVKTVIGSFSSNPFELRAPYDIFSLFTMLGMDGKKVKESLTFDI